MGERSTIGASAGGTMGKGERSTMEACAGGTKMGYFILANYRGSMVKWERSTTGAFTGALYRGILYWHTLWGH